MSRISRLFLTEIRKISPFLENVRLLLMRTAFLVVIIRAIKTPHIGSISLHNHCALGMAKYFTNPCTLADNML